MRYSRTFLLTLGLKAPQEVDLNMPSFQPLFNSLYLLT